MNNYLKELCKLAGIDAPCRRIAYKGNERIDEIKPKYEWISSHCGRRTFCVMHLSAGTSPDIVRKWTGHKTEKTMRPYKGITEKARKAAMPAIEQFDVLCEKKQVFPNKTLPLKKTHDIWQRRTKYKRAN